VKEQLSIRINLNVKNALNTLKLTMTTQNAKLKSVDLKTRSTTLREFARSVLMDTRQMKLAETAL